MDSIAQKLFDSLASFSDEEVLGGVTVEFEHDDMIIVVNTGEFTSEKPIEEQIDDTAISIESSPFLWSKKS